MGVSGLWSHLTQAGTSHNLETIQLAALADAAQAAAAAAAVAAAAASSSSSSSSSSSPYSKRFPVIGVDLSAWLFHARQSVEGSNPDLRLIFFRLARLLTFPIQTIFVFDGPYRPRVKRGRVVAGKKHPLTGPLVEIITAFGMVAREAPGEAEAELARMNSEGLIDGVLTDDVDALIFGARAVMRNWSATLSGNKVAAAADDHADNTATVYKASDILDLPDLCLDRNGLILVALMAGGDYDVGGLGRCGPTIAIGLAQAGLGDALVKGFRKHCKVTGYDPMTRMPMITTSSAWPAFIASWREEICSELANNTHGFLTKRQKSLAQSSEMKTFLDTTESLEVLGSYCEPITSWTLLEGSSQSAGRQTARLKFAKPDIAAIATFSQRMFAWGPRATVGRLRNVLWKGVVLQDLRSSDHGGIASSAIKRIHAERRHTSTGLLLEYRLEIDPTDLAKMAESGIDPLLNVGPGYDEPLPSDLAPPSSQASTAHSRTESGSEDDVDEPALPFEFVLSGEEEDVPTSPLKKKRAKPYPGPYEPLRMWVLQESLLQSEIGQQLIKEYMEGKLKGRKSTSKSSKKLTASRAANQPSIDSLFSSTSHKSATAVQQPSKPMRPPHPSTDADITFLPPASSQPARLNAVPPPSPSKRYTQTQLLFPKRTFGRTQSGPAVFSDDVAQSSSPAASAASVSDPIGLFESSPLLPRSSVQRPPAIRRRASMDDESFTLISSDDDEDEGATAVGRNMPQIPSSQPLPAASQRSRGTTFTSRPTSRLSPILSASTHKATIFSSSLQKSKSIKAKSISPPAPRITKQKETQDSHSDPDSSLPDAQTFLLTTLARRSQSTSPLLGSTSAAIGKSGGNSSGRMRKKKRRGIGRGMREGSDDDDDVDDNDGNAGDAHQAITAALVEQLAGDPLRRPVDPPQLHSKSRSESASQVQAPASRTRRRGARKSDAIVLSDSD